MVEVDYQVHIVLFVLLDLDFKKFEEIYEIKENKDKN